MRLAKRAHDRLRRAGHPAPRRPVRRRPRRDAVGQPAARRRPRRRRASSTASRCPCGTRSPRDGIADLDRAGAEGRRRATSGSRCPRAADATGAHGGGPQGRSAPASGGSTRRRRERERLIKTLGRPEAEAVDLPDRRDRRHLRGHPAGAGGRSRGRRHHRGDPLDRAVAARLRAGGRRPARASPAPTRRRRTSG